MGVAHQLRGVVQKFLHASRAVFYLSTPIPEILDPPLKRDYLSFRLQLAEELIGGFSSWKRAGRRPSGEHLNMQRLTVDLGHWPEQSPKSLGCVVCKTKKSRHESCIICSVSKVHLCIHGSRDCFKKYHTLVEYWH